MQRHHTGSGRRTVIPADWETTHRTVATGSLRGRVSVREAGTVQGWDDELEQNVAVPHEPFLSDVPARVLQLTSAGDGRVVTADDEETLIEYLVVLDAAVDTIREGHLVDVTASTDPMLTGLVLHVDKVGRGTERFTRDLFCTVN